MKIEVLYSKKNEKILKVNNIYINSKYDASLEAKIFIDGYSHVLEDNVIHIIGLGLGYHVKEILKRIKNKKIKIYILNKELYNFIKDEVKEIINNKNIKIYFEDNIVEFFNTIKSANDIIICRSLLKICEDEKVKNKIENYLIVKKGIERFSSIMKENKVYNESKNHSKISEFIKRKGKKIKVITSAGPSLDVIINDLKKYREYYDIYAVGSSLKTLVNNNIIPDAIIIIDATDIVAKQFKDNNNLNVPLCFLSTASRWAIDNYNGPKYIFYNEENEENIIIETGKTVAVASIDLAIKSGAEKIILAGQDLAYLNNRTHVTTFEEVYGEKDEIFADDKSIKVEDVFGNYISTNKGYLLFKENIENLIEKNNKIKFYNCSLGAKIKGAEFIYLYEYF